MRTLKTISVMMVWCVASCALLSVATGCIPDEVTVLLGDYGNPYGDGYYDGYYDDDYVVIEIWEEW